MATSVEDYIAGLPEWQANLAEEILKTVLSASPALVPVIKWAQPVFEANGPVCYIKGHKNHLTFGFWRGTSLMELDDRLETSGDKMAHIKFTDGMSLQNGKIKKLVKAAVELNRTLGNPNMSRKSGEPQSRRSKS